MRFFQLNVKVRTYFSRHHSLVLEVERALLGLQSADKHCQKLFVQDELLEALKVLDCSLMISLLGNIEGKEDRVVIAGTWEEETHCKCAEVTIGEIFVGGDVYQVGKVCLEFREG